MIYDIAIIGYGPTGATLANLLVQNGMSVLVVDREAAMYHLPRAVHFDDEVMRVFQTVGIAEDLSKKVRVNPGMKFVDDDDTLLLDWPRPKEITAHGWHASYRLHQPDLESLLRRKLEDNAHAHILTSFDVTEIKEANGCVSLSGISQNRAVETYKARYLVGCDGAKSLTRSVIGSAMEDLGFDERWLVVDLLLKRPRPDLGDHSVQFCNPDRPMTYCRSPGNRRRWEITVKPEETDNEITAPNRVWRFLSRWIGPEDATLERRAVYTFRSQVATCWRKGRIMIAGDAAHLTPPFMGQGMCAGIRDASNLAWKLMSCVNGADDSLLDTYQAERSPHARAYVETAMRLGGLINALDREAALKMAEDGSSGATKMRSIAPRLGESALAQTKVDDRIGRPFGQFDIGDGQCGFDARIGYHHAIISPIKPAIMPVNCQWIDPSKHQTLAAELSGLESAAVWVRPDRYIGGMSDNCDDLLTPLFPYFNLEDQNQNETCLS